jgi:predicted restriction endonuclease
MKEHLHRCELCGIRGLRLLDRHHIVPVSQGGSDKPWNRVNLCPNDHRRVHRGLIVIDGWESLGWTHILNVTIVDPKDAIPLAQN